MNISLTLTVAGWKLPALADALAAAGLLDAVEASAVPTSGQASATITPEKQAAAIDSAKKGTAAPKADKPKADKTPVEALKEAVDKEKAETPTPPRTYETTAIPGKVAEAVKKNRDAVVALLGQFQAEKDGKPSAKWLKPEQFDEFEAAIDKILAPSEDLG